MASTNNKMVLYAYLNVLKPTCLSGNRRAILAALEVCEVLGTGTPNWLVRPLSEIVQKAADGGAKGKGPKGTVEGAIARNWIDLQRQIAVERCQKQLLQDGKKPLKKIALQMARDSLIGSPAYGSVSAIAASDGRIRAEMKKSGFISLSSFVPGSPENFADYIEELEPQE